jgi:hypothetical protein
LEQSASKGQRLGTIRTELAPTKDQARCQAEEIKSPRTDSTIIEIIGVEDGGGLGVLVPPSLPRIWPKRSEVLEVKVPHDDAFAWWAFGKHRNALEQLVEQRGGATQKRKWRR